MRISSRETGIKSKPEPHSSDTRAPPLNPTTDDKGREVESRTEGRKGILSGEWRSRAPIIGRSVRSPPSSYTTAPNVRHNLAILPRWAVSTGKNGHLSLSGSPGMPR